MPVAASAQVTDTAAVLKKLVSEFKSLRNVGYSYVMNTSFPNGDKDQIKGTMFLDNENELYYNDCDAFTMLYTAHWFYKADHRNKTLTLVNLDKDYNKELKKATEKAIFQNGAAFTFLDSVIAKTATIKKMNNDGDMLKITLGFPKSQSAQKIELEYNEASQSFGSYNMTVHTPWRRTAKGIQVIETTIKCIDFKKVTDKSRYDERNFFFYNNGKLELKKYNNYKFSNKM